MPQSVPIVSITQPVPGTLISTQGLPDAVVQRHARSHVDVTERVRIPTRSRSDPSYVHSGNKRLPVIVVAAGGVLVLGIVMFATLRGDRSAKSEPESSAAVHLITEPATTQEIVKPAEPPPRAAPAPVVIDKPTEKTTEKAIAKPVEVTPEVVEEIPQAAKPQPTRPKVVKIVKPHPKLPEIVKTTKTDLKPKIESKAKAEPKENQWNADSPFLPVRPEQR